MGWLLTAGCSSNMQGTYVPILEMHSSWNEFTCFIGLSILLCTRCIITQENLNRHLLAILLNNNILSPRDSSGIAGRMTGIL